MLYLVVFYTAQLLVSLYALRRGGAPERVVALAMLAAAALNTVVTYFHRVFAVVNLGGLLLDVAFMVVLLIVAGRANRFWPLFVASLHLLGIGIHGVRAFDPDLLPVVYARAPAAVAYPMLLLLVIGTVGHNRRAARRVEGERDWSTFRW